MEDVALGFFDRDGDAGVLGELLFGGGPPFLKFHLADELGEGDLEVDRGRGVVFVGLQGFHDKLGGVLLDKFGDDFRLRLLTGEDVFRGQHLHGVDAKGRIHLVAGFVGEVDGEALSSRVVALDLPEAPAAMDDK